MVIVNMASIAATRGLEDRFAYSMTKVRGAVDEDALGGEGLYRAGDSVQSASRRRACIRRLSMGLWRRTTPGARRRSSGEPWRHRSRLDAWALRGRLRSWRCICARTCVFVYDRRRCSDRRRVLQPALDFFMGANRLWTGDSRDRVIVVQARRGRRDWQGDLACVPRRGRAGGRRQPGLENSEAVSA